MSSSTPAERRSPVMYPVMPSLPEQPQRHPALVSHTLPRPSMASKLGYHQSLGYTASKTFDQFISHKHHRKTCIIGFTFYCGFSSNYYSTCLLMHDCIWCNHACRGYMDPPRSPKILSRKDQVGSQSYRAQKQLDYNFSTRTKEKKNKNKREVGGLLRDEKRGWCSGEHG